MRDYLKLGITLLLITAIAGFALGLTHELTKDAIAYQEALRAGNILIPGAATLESIDEDILDEILGSQQFASVRDVRKGVAAGKTYGYQIDTMVVGYGGPMEVSVAINTEGKVVGIRIGAHTETPGLGAKITEESFLKQFIGLDMAKGVRVVKGTPKEGEVAAITGATISANAVGAAVKQALEVYNGHLSSQPVTALPGEPKKAAFPDAVFVDIDEEIFAVIKDANRSLESIKGAYVGGVLVGYEIFVKPRGYNETIDVTVSMDLEGKIIQVDIGAHGETPGLGDKIESPEFLNKFKGLASNDEVRSVDAISSATSSSNGVKDGVSRSARIFAEYINIENPPFDSVVIDPEMTGFDGGQFRDIDVGILNKAKDENSSLRYIKEAFVNNEKKGYLLNLIPKGFDGPVEVFVSLDNNGVVVRVCIGQHSETPTLGDQIEKPEYRDKFKNISNPDDVNSVDGITGATYSANAVKEAVASALRIYKGQLGGGR